MELKRTHYGLSIKIGEGEVNSELNFELRQVRQLNKNVKGEEKLKAELEAKESQLTLEYIKLAADMEAVFDGGFEAVKAFENFNEHFHDRMDEIEKEINALCLEFCDRSKHGWCM